jgi:hypothetical protein
MLECMRICSSREQARRGNMPTCRPCVQRDFCAITLHHARPDWSLHQDRHPLSSIAAHTHPGTHAHPYQMQMISVQVEVASSRIHVSSASLPPLPAAGLLSAESIAVVGHVHRCQDTRCTKVDLEIQLHSMTKSRIVSRTCRLYCKSSFESITSIGSLLWHQVKTSVTVHNDYFHVVVLYGEGGRPSAVHASTVFSHM